MKDNFLKDLNAGRRILMSYTASSFMSWDGGSSLIFWRWPPDSQVSARDGLSPYFIGCLPSNMRAPKRIRECDKEKLVNKIITCLERGYLTFTRQNKVESYIDYFAVPKGEYDIIMIFNGSSYGLNSVMFASNF